MSSGGIAECAAHASRAANWRELDEPTGVGSCERVQEFAVVEDLHASRQVAGRVEGMSRVDPVCEATDDNFWSR
jgi:hypothetical protein